MYALLLISSDSKNEYELFDSRISKNIIRLTPPIKVVYYIMVKPGVTTLRGTVASSGPAIGDVTTIGMLPMVNVRQARVITVESAFDTFTHPDGSKLLSPDQIEKLIQIKLANGRDFFDISTEINKFYLFSLVGDINENGFDDTFNDLIGGRDGKGDPFRDRDDYYFNVSLNMRSARHKAQIDSEIYRDKVDVSEGAFTCFKCNSKKTIAVEKQMRSADEPMTITVICVECDNTWRG